MQSDSFSNHDHNSSPPHAAGGSEPRVLAFESATLPGSLAMLAGTEVRWATQLDAQQKTTRRFAAAIQEGLTEVGWTVGHIQLLAVCRGPGSFTGLRIGLTMAKLWAYARATPIVAASTLDLVARQAPITAGLPDRVAVGIDAQRGQWFGATYRRGAGPAEMTPLELPHLVVSPQEWLDQLASSGPWTLTGPALASPRHWAIPQAIELAPPECWSPRAATLGQLAVERWRAGQVDDPWSLAPLYLRASAPEELRAARDAAGRVAKDRGLT